MYCYSNGILFCLYTDLPSHHYNVYVMLGVWYSYSLLLKCNKKMVCIVIVMVFCSDCIMRYLPTTTMFMSCQGVWYSYSLLLKCYKKMVCMYVMVFCSDFIMRSLPTSTMIVSGLGVWYSYLLLSNYYKKKVHIISDGILFFLFDDISSHHNNACIRIGGLVFKIYFVKV